LKQELGTYTTTHLLLNDDYRFPMFLAGDDVSTCGLCRILVERAKAFFLSSWRILEPHGCSVDTLNALLAKGGLPASPAELVEQ